MENTEGADSASSVAALWSRGVLVDLDIGSSDFQRRCGSDALAVPIDFNAITNPSKKLLPKDALKPFKDIEGEARSYLSSHSLNFPLQGARFVYFKALSGILEKLKTCKHRWVSAVTTLTEEYPHLCVRQLTVLNNQSESIAEASISKFPEGPLRDRARADWSEWLERQKLGHIQMYPSVDDLPAMFRFEWRMFKISGDVGLDAMSELEREEMQAAQERMRRELGQWVVESSAAVHHALGEASRNALELLHKNNKLGSRSIKALFDQFEVFCAVDFTGASPFQQRLDEARQRFASADHTHIAERISGPGGDRDYFTELLSELGRLSTGTVAREAGVGAISNVPAFRRLVDLS